MSQRLRLLFEFSRYFLVSVLALGVDMGALLLLAQFIHYVFAATASFLLGAVAHYFLSVQFVFKWRRMLSRRWLEVGIFIGSGMLALLVNVTAITIGVEWLDLQLFWAKLLAAGCSFVFGYGLRKLMLF